MKGASEMQPQIIEISGSPIKNSNTDLLIQAVLESSGLNLNLKGTCFWMTTAGFFLLLTKINYSTCSTIPIDYVKINPIAARFKE